MSDLKTIRHCQICAESLEPFCDLGNIPLVDALGSMHQPMTHQRFATPLAFCRYCRLVQLNNLVNKHLLFPGDYPYTSGTTANLRNNFINLFYEINDFLKLTPTDLVIDIGCNDGTLLENFLQTSRVLGVTPENIGPLKCQPKGIPIDQSFFTEGVAKRLLTTHGQARLICLTNVFAHFDDIDDFMKGINALLTKDGVVIVEAGYLVNLINGMQYDSVHHEHLRYYSLYSLMKLFDKYDMQVIDAQRIPTHGGSIRVWASRLGAYPIHQRVYNLILEENKCPLNPYSLSQFADAVKTHQRFLKLLLEKFYAQGKTIGGIGAPGRAAALLNYAGIDSPIIKMVAEVEGSIKIDKYVPGTTILIVDENRFLSAPPDYALILAWHIAEELMHKFKRKGFKGDFIIPLPNPTIVKNADVK